MILIALPWSGSEKFGVSIRNTYCGGHYCGWVARTNNMYQYNWCSVIDQFSSNYVFDWGERTNQFAPSEAEAKHVVDSELIKWGWKLLENDSKLLALL